MTVATSFFEAFGGKPDNAPSEAPAPAPAAQEEPPVSLFKAFEKGSESAQPTTTSTALSPFVGFNQGLVSLAGGPVDLASWALSKAGVPVSEAPIGGSESIKRALDVINANPYAEIFEPKSTTEKVFQAGGAGAGQALGLAAAAPAVVPRIAAYAPRIGEFLESLIGLRTPTGSAAAPAAELGTVGFTSGVGTELAEMAVPKEWKGLAGLGGGLAGGAIGTLGTAAAQAIPVMARGVGEYFAPRTQAGQEKLASKNLAELFKSPQAALDVLQNEPTPGLPGVPKTTFETVGEAGGPQLGAAQRKAEMLSPESFEGIRSQQNAALIGELGKVQPQVAPEKLSDRLSQRFKDLDDSYTDTQAKAEAAARAEVDKLGGNLTPDQYGNFLRQKLNEQYDKMLVARKKLYDAVDPEGKLVLSVKEILNKAKSLQEDIDPYTQPLSSDAKRLLDQANSMTPYLNFKNLRSFDTALSSAMREEEMTKGRSNNWRILQELKSSVYDTMGRAIESEHTAEQAAVSQGTIKPSETIGARINNAAREAGEAPPVFGETAPSVFTSDLNKYKVFYPGGDKPIEVRYEVVDAPSLITSHTNDLTINPNYLQELQPRDRTTIHSELQIDNISKNPIPEKLGPNPDINSGAPIVGPDNMVESGNGRSIGLRKAYEGSAADNYRAWLESNGFNTTGIENPILIGRRTTELTPEERIKMVQAAASNPGLELTAVELANVDSRRVGNVINKIKSPDLTVAANEDFVRAFADQIPKNEYGNFFDIEGNLSPRGVQRLESALMSYTFGEPALMQRVFNNTDNNIKSLSNALVDASGSWGKMKRAVADGSIDPSFDITPDLTKNIDLVMRARDEGQPYGFYLRQGDMFSTQPSEATRRMLSADGQNLNSTKKITEFLNAYANEALSTAGGATMFGAPPTAEEVMQRTIDRLKTQPKGGPKFPESPAAASAEAAPKEAAPEAPAAKPKKEAVKPIPAEAPTAETAYTQAAFDRLKAAKEKHKEVETTYRQGPVEDILKTFGFAGQYQMLDSNVVGRIFSKGPQGYDKAQAFLKAAQGDPAAINMAKDYIAYTFKRDVLTDGIVDPKKFENWKKQYSDALRAFPDEAAKFNDANTASKYVEALASDRKDALDNFRAGTVGKIMGLSEPQDVTRTVGNLFNRADSVKQFSNLAKLTASDPVARDGLRSAIAQHINDKFIALSRTASSEDRTLMAKGFRDFMQKNAPALRTVFKPEEIGSMNAIANELGILNQSIASTQSAGKGNVRDLFAALERSRTRPGQDPSERTAVSNLAKIGASGAAGFEAAGTPGAKLAITGAIGNIIFNSARQAGLRNIDQMMIEALANPELAKAMLMKAPIRANTGSEITVADKFRKLPIYSLMSSQRPDMSEEASYDRARRASGGRTGMNVESAADELVKLAETTKKQLGQETEPLLNEHDNTIARALEVANQAI
jgi:hypothetical protein